MNSGQSFLKKMLARLYNMSYTTPHPMHRAGGGIRYTSCYLLYDLCCCLLLKKIMITIIDYKVILTRNLPRVESYDAKIGN